MQQPSHGAFPKLPVPKHKDEFNIVHLPMRGVQSYGETVGILGAGTYGEVRVVCKAPCIRDEEKVAIKSSKVLDGAIEISLLREGATLAQLSHPNIISLIDIALRDGTFALVQPVAVASLHQYRGKLTPRDVGLIAYQLARALAYLDSTDVWHRDLKPANVLLYREACTAQGVEAAASTPMAVLADFGLARVGMCAYEEEMVEFAGTIMYMAPEILLGGRYTRAAEIWALGCTLFEAFTGVPAFLGNTEPELLVHVFRTFGAPSEISWPGLRSFPGWRPEYDTIRSVDTARFAVLDVNTRDFLLQMLVLDPKGRPTANQLVHTPGLQTFREHVERCSPVKELTPLNCLEEAEAAQIPPQEIPEWMTPEKKLVVIEWLEELRERTEASLRTLFLATQLVDRYLTDVPETSTGDVVVLCQASMHIASNLLESEQVPLAKLLDAESNANIAKYLAEYELRLLKTLHFDVLRTTSYDILKAVSHYISPETLEITTLLLRIVSREMLVYEAYPDELVYTCLILASSHTRERFRFPDRVKRERYSVLIPRLLEEATIVTDNRQASERLYGSQDKLRTFLRSIPLAREYIREGVISKRSTARSVSKQLS